MADNTDLNLGAGGDRIRTVDLNGVKTQVVKIEQLVTLDATVVYE